MIFNQSINWFIYMAAHDQSSVYIVVAFMIKISHTIVRMSKNS